MCREGHRLGEKVSDIVGSADCKHANRAATKKLLQESSTKLKMFNAANSQLFEMTEIANKTT